MKHKFLFIISSVFLTLSLSTSAFSIDLGKELQKVTGNKDIAKSVENIGGIDKKIEEAISKIKDETLGEVNKVTEKVEGEINSIKEKIEAEEKKVRDVIKEAEEGINKFREIKNNIGKYITIAAALVGLLASGIFALAFFVWKAWRNIAGFKKLVQNVTNYDDIKAKIEALENQIAELQGKKVAAEVKTNNPIPTQQSPQAAAHVQQAPQPQAAATTQEAPQQPAKPVESTDNKPA